MPEWSDEEAAAPSVGQRLPVVDAPQPRASATVAPAAPDKGQTLPLRVQGTAGARDMPQTRDAPGTTIVPSEEGDFWYATVTSMVAQELIGALARELALQSQLVGRDDDQWLLRVERESLSQAGSRDKLTAALAALGHSVKIAIEIGAVNDSPARRNKLASEARQRAAEEAIQSDPLVQSMMRDFDARIVPGSLRPA
jgi:DNA polymerase-3 subunit gamma/tau